MGDHRNNSWIAVSWGPVPKSTSSARFNCAGGRSPPPTSSRSGAPVTRHLLTLLLVSCRAAAFAQTNAASQAARTWRQGHERAIVDEFVALLAIPNIASDRANIQRNAEAIAAMMREARHRARSWSRCPEAIRSSSARFARPGRRERWRSTRTTTASRSTRRNGRHRRSSRRCVTSAWKMAVRCIPLPPAAHVRSRVEAVRPRRRRRQGADRRDAGRGRRDARGRESP